jgi:hypothetical protein
MFMPSKSTPATPTQRKALYWIQQNGVKFAEFGNTNTPPLQVARSVCGNKG